MTSISDRALTRSLLLVLALWTAARPAPAAESEAAEPAAAPEAKSEFAGTITVHAPSRREESLLEAPAAVTSLSEAEIGARALSGELPQLLAGSPGVELHQGSAGVYELNSRGFGGDFNRRIAVVLDGRDVASPLNGAYEWSFLSNLVDLAQVELVRGPGSALYGANAYNGVLSLVTRSAAEGGGRARLSGGSLGALRGELSWARRFDERWSAKLAATASESGTFLRDRTQTTEYDGLPREAIAPPRDEIRFAQLALRVDRATRRGLWTAEAGSAESLGTTRVSGAGRLQTVEEDRRSWARVAVDDPRGRLTAYWNEFRVPDRLYLSFGGSVAERSSKWRVEVARDEALFAGRAQLRVGAAYGEEHTDSADAAGAQTMLLGAVRAEDQALFAQLDLPFREAWRAVAAARWDASSLYSSRFSPKLGVVWSRDARQSFRLTAHRAYQEPNYFELFSDLPSFVSSAGGFGSSVDLGAIEGAQCAPHGLDCGFARPTPARQRGNSALDVEEITTWELGYTRLASPDDWLQASYYRSRLESFISESLPNPHGAVNPRYGPYRPPAGHPAPAALLAALEAALGPLFPFLTHDLDGTPLLVTYSVTNAARVDTQGLEIGARRALGRRWRGELSYTWFDFEVRDPGLGGELVANAPRHSGSLGLVYRAGRDEAWARWRWVEGFRWAIGGFDGRVPTFDVVTLGARRELGARAALQLEVENALGRRYFEIFGGDLLGRRWLAAVDLRW